MTTAEVRPVVVVEPSSARVRAGVVVFSHAVIDVFPYVIVSLLPLFRTRLELDDTQTALLLATGSVASGVSQPAAAWFSDRLDSRLMAPVGLLLAGVSVGLLGYVASFWQLLLLQVVSSLGVGAYHPIAAAAAGRLGGAKRSLVLSIFFLAGMLGGVTGNSGAPRWVDAMSDRGAGMAPALEVGLRSLHWLIPCALVFALAVWWAIRRVGHRTHDGHERHRALPADARRRRWQAVWVLYVGNVLRFIVNMALVQLFVLWAEQRAEARAAAAIGEGAIGLMASNINGTMQASMQVGMGAAGLAAGIALRSHHEKGALVVLPCVAAAAVCAVPLVDGGGADGGLAAVVLLAAVAGAGYGGLIPLTLSLSQRLLPHRTGLASGLMLGGAWCFGGIGPFLANFVRGLPGVGLDGAFVVIGGVLLVSGLCALVLRGDVVGMADK